MRTSDSARPVRHLAALLPLIGLVMAIGVLVATQATGILAASPDPNVSIVDGAYKPASLTIAQHTAVFWRNDDNKAHSVTADDGSFDSGQIGPGDAFGNVFDHAGTFSYHDTSNPSIMRGTITVTPVAATPVPTGATPPPGTLPPNFHTPIPAATDTPAPATPAASLVPIDSNSQGAGPSIVLAGALLLIVAVTLIIVAARRRRRN